MKKEQHLTRGNLSPSIHLPCAPARYCQNHVGMEACNRHSPVVTSPIDHDDLALSGLTQLRQRLCNGVRLVEHWDYDGNQHAIFILLHGERRGSNIVERFSIPVELLCPSLDRKSVV